MNILRSTIDDSVNFVTDTEHGALEARYVRRLGSEVICYISSQHGCNQGCTMCHLTATGQVSGRNARAGAMVLQAKQVLAHYDDVDGIGAELVNFNFMARGEPMMNPAVDRALFEDLHEESAIHGLVPRFKLSTIFPQKGPLDAREWLNRFGAGVDLYWSFYSHNPSVRGRWMPNARSPASIVTELKRWQDLTHKIPVIHFPIIEGQNDDVGTWGVMGDVLRGLHVQIRIVRYNPPAGSDSVEGDFEAASRFFSEWFHPDDVQVVPRVGEDVMASCGMFA